MKCTAAPPTPTHRQGTRFSPRCVFRLFYPLSRSCHCCMRSMNVPSSEKFACKREGESKTAKTYLVGDEVPVVRDKPDLLFRKRGVPVDVLREIGVVALLHRNPHPRPVQVAPEPCRHRRTRVHPHASPGLLPLLIFSLSIDLLLPTTHAPQRTA